MGAVGLQVFLYLQKKRKKGERERENARKIREKARNSDFNIISFILFYIFFLSPLSRIFAILSRIFAFSIPPL
jgi:hypothetical protein